MRGRGHGDSVSGLWWKNHEKVLVSCALDGKVKFWDMSRTQRSASTDIAPTASQSTGEGEAANSSKQSRASSPPRYRHSPSRQMRVARLQPNRPFLPPPLSTSCPPPPPPQPSSHSSTDSIATSTTTNTADPAEAESEPSVAPTQSVIAVHSAIDAAEAETDEPSLF